MRVIFTILACLWAAPAFAQYPSVPCAPGAGSWVFTSVARLYVCAPDGLSWASDASPYLVTVQALSDLPAPVSGVITLADNTTYQVTGEVDLGTNRIVWGARSGLVGTNRVNDRLVYTGTGTMFTIASGAVVGFFQEIGLRAPNGTLLDVSGVSLAMIDVTFGTIGTGGTIAASGSFSFSIRASSMVNAFTTTGFTFTGTTTSALRVFDNLARGNVGTLLNLGTASFGVIDIGRNIVDTSVGQTFMNGTTGGANVTSAGIMVSNAFTGAGTGVATVTATDTNWFFGSNHGVADSIEPVVQTALSAKQATLVSATNIKTINGSTVLGSGDLTVSGSAAWGGITGTLSAQTDLQSALDGKLATTGNGGSLTGLTKTQVGLANVDNTADASKSVGSAATLQTPRNINGVPFNGSANITVTAAADTLSGTTLAALSGVNLTNLDASDLASGTVPTARMGSGTANSTTFLRGDSTWAAPPGAPTYVVTVADTTNATTAYANITGMVIPVLASTRYRISCVFPYDANATTTGIGIGWTGPASPTLTRGLMTSGLTTATVGGTTSAGNDTGGVTTGSVATTNNVATFEGIWSNGANAGNIQMRVKSEVAIANAIIVRTGAVCSAAVY